MKPFSIIAILGFIGTAALTLAIILASPSPSKITIPTGNGDDGYPVASPKPQSEIDFYRNNLLLGHSLAIYASQSPQTNVTDITVANPTNSHSFSDCRVTQEIFLPFLENNPDQSKNNLQQALNVTLQTYPSIKPHFIENVEAPSLPEVLEKNFVANISKSENAFNHTEYSHRIAGRSWFVLECTKPIESIASPAVTIGGGTNSIVYHARDTVTARGIVGFSEITIKVLKPGNVAFIDDTKIKTASGGSFVYSFTLPDNVGENGMIWSVQIKMPDSSMIEYSFLVE